MVVVMNEREQAILIANRWLDNPPDMMRDPDCDYCIVARQLIRASEENAKLKQEIRKRWLFDKQ